MKHNFFKIVAVLVFTILAVSTSFAQSTANATASTSATVITPISILKAGDMNFGVVVPGGSATTVTLTTAGVRSSSEGFAALMNGGSQHGTISAASFTVSGQASYTYAITFPGTIHLSDGNEHSMDVKDWVTSPSITGTLDGTGNQTLSVGATLYVGASQAAGSYTNESDLNIIVNYN